MNPPRVPPITAFIAVSALHVVLTAGFLAVDRYRVIELPPKQVWSGPINACDGSFISELCRPISVDILY
jgi:hypothetical protein